MAASPTWTMIGRGLRARCPICGLGKIFKSYLDHHERCAVCGLRFEREQGYFVGGMEISMLIAFLAPIVCVFTIGRVIPVPAIVWVAMSAALSLALFQPSRGLWLAMDLSIDPSTDADRPPDDERPPCLKPDPHPRDAARVK